MTAIEYLRRMHDRLRAGVSLMAELEEQLRWHSAGEDQLSGFERVVEYLRSVVVPHLRGELAVLYPESRLLVGIDPLLVERLIDNCEQIQCHAERIIRDRDRLRAGVMCDKTGCRRHITSTVRLLRRHLEAVETVLLPQLALHLSDEDVYAIYEREEEAQFEAAVELGRALVAS